MLTPHHSATEPQRAWWRFYQWLFWRRLSQMLVLLLFLLGPWAGIWIIQGNLSASLILETLPMTDLLLFAQVVAAQGVPALQVALGVLLVVGVYGVLGGRFFCAWVCPVNMVTDLASWLRRRMGITKGWRGSRSIRFGVLVLVLLLAAGSGTLLWEWINPVALLHRGVIFGLWLGLLVVLGIFFFDLLVSPHGWCGRLCPTGAAYSLLSHVSLLRVDAARREVCTDCRECYKVCPEPQVIDLPLRGAERGIGPTITDVQCTNCGRCIDVCPEDVYQFAFHLPNKSRVAL
ncbi:quinol dehydrogenase ferredoxin subunit NapH [Candidatus Magnetaquicoccus inordinatus]|uniref:quinol dehydrogenase ferredoxin subunit NapH n=1 Tax=Candidatus Magnetaquicoccus inordinatus TaxID=2496818 RepID=UPI001D0EAC30|nr:quinol dehydrogenase ferredoxin subunit NapH [Candidatus Magnetaquicoccus inordinatus]